MAIVCVIADLFYIDKKDIILHYNKFPNLGVCHANFPNLKGPRVPSQNCKKIPWFLNETHDFCIIFQILTLFSFSVNRQDLGIFIFYRSQHGIHRQGTKISLVR